MTCVNNMNEHNQKYLYNYSCQEDEIELCALEMRSFFGEDSDTNLIESNIKIDPSRSPFIRDRIDIIFEGNELQDIIEQVKSLRPLTATYRVIYIKTTTGGKVGFEERRKVEREVALEVPGEPDLKHPELSFGIVKTNEKWVFGYYHKGEAIWLHHQKKPNGYSTALSTRVARAVANIAVPDPLGIKAIDPCCGIGTVLVEALSMGIDIVGSDVNPLILPGTRENIAHFGYHCEVLFRDIRKVTGKYDVAIIDMPYNLCSVISPQEKLELIQSAHSFADKIVIVTIEPMDSIIEQAGFQIVDRCIVKKGTFSRQVIVGKNKA
jgi:tRNA G10  N-methylase Trm11